MQATINKIRHTNDSKILAVTRITLGVLLLMTGLMKLFVPMLGDAFSQQLIQAKIPFYAFNIYFVPLTEVIIGACLVLGFFSRIGASLTINMMLVATYVHIVVHDPKAFPLQPTQPIIPVVVILMSTYILLKGGGAWSRDLNAHS